LGGARGAAPIVAVTADAMPEQVALCMAAGMDAHVSKPLRPDALFSVIEDALSRPGRAPSLAARA
jgi:CheY-like chemotaxis protein